MAKYLREILPLDEGKYTYKTEGPKPSDKNPKWVKRLLSPKTKAKYATNRRRKEMSKKHPELSEELDEGKTERDIDLYTTKGDRDREQQNKSGKLRPPLRGNMAASNQAYRDKIYKARTAKLRSEQAEQQPRDVPVTKKPDTRPLIAQKFGAGGAGSKEAFGGATSTPARTSRGMYSPEQKAVADVKAGRSTVAAKKPAIPVPNEETELDEAKRSAYKRKGSMRAQTKTKATIDKEKRARRKLARAAIKTGQKVKFRPFGRWSSKRKLKEDLQELSLQRVGSFIDKATYQDYDRGSTKHRKGINLALRKRGEHKHAFDVPPKVRASIDGKKR